MSFAVHGAAHLHAGHNGQQLAADITAQLQAVRRLLSSKHASAEPRSDVVDHGREMPGSLVNMFTVHFSNGFSIRLGEEEAEESDGQGIAIGLYIGVSLINHSCEPNCCPTFSRTGTLTLRTLRPISVGEALSISYLHRSVSLPPF